MAEQIRAPYGDIVFYQSPYTDQAVNRLYQEQKMRESKQQQENQMLDAQFSKEIGKTRSIDQPDIIGKYQQYKQLKKQLLFDKKLQRDPVAYNQLQQQANLAYQDALKTSSKSAELNELGKTLVTDRIKTPDNYEDDFGDRITAFQNTPLSAGGKVVYGGQEVDLFNPDTYRYKGSNTDFQKIMQTAVGTPKPTHTAEEPVDKDGLQTKMIPYSFGNSPAQVRDHILASLGDRSNARSAAFQFDQLPPGEFEKTALAYTQIPKDKLQKMGLASVQDILPKTLDNKAANFASYKAMRYALDNEPTMGTPQYRTNMSEQMKLQQKNRKELEAIRNANQAGLVKLRDSLKQKSAKEQENWLTKTVDGLLEEAANDKGAGIIPSTNEIRISPELKKALGNSDFYRLMPNGKIGYFDYDRYGKGETYGSDAPKDLKGKPAPEGGIKIDKNGNPIVSEDNKGEFSKQEFKALIGKKLIGIKALNQSLDAEDNDTEELDNDVNITELRGKYKY